MIISTDLTDKAKNELIAQIDFYKRHYSSVELVQCMKCKADLCLELSGLIGAGIGLKPNEQGIVVIPVSAKLLSTRMRNDETGTGEFMRGYQCECGNDNRVSDNEKAEGLPVGPQPVSTDPFLRHTIRERLKAKGITGNFKRRGEAKYFDKFKVVRV